MRERLAVIGLIFAGLLACRDGLSPEPEAKKPLIGLMTISIRESTPARAYGIFVGTTDRDSTREDLGHLYLFEKNPSTTFILKEGEKVSVSVNALEVSAVGSGITYEYFTDWKPSTDSGRVGVTHNGISDMVIVADGLKQLDWNKWEIAPRLFYILTSKDTSFRARIPLPPNEGPTIRFVFPVQTRKFGCTGNDDIIVRSAKGISTGVTSAGETVMQPPKQIHSLRISCAMYENEIEAKAVLSRIVADRVLTAWRTSPDSLYEKYLRPGTKDPH